MSIPKKGKRMRKTGRVLVSNNKVKSKGFAILPAGHRWDKEELEKLSTSLGVAESNRDSTIEVGGMKLDVGYAARLYLHLHARFKANPKLKAIKKSYNTSNDDED